MANYNKQIGEWLHQQRINKGYSQQQIADLIGVSRSIVSYWEKGKRTIFANDLIEYCKVLKVSPSALLNDLFEGN